MHFLCPVCSQTSRHWIADQWPFQGMHKGKGVLCTSALDAVRWAAVEARSTQCPLSFVHTLEWPLVSYPVPAGLRANWTQEMHEQGRRWLQEAQEAAEFAAPGIQAQVHPFTGDPRERLLAEAEHAYELVIGSRGLGGFAGMLLGSTSAT